MIAPQTTDEIKQALKKGIAEELAQDKRQLDFLKKRIAKNEALMTSLNASLSVEMPARSKSKQDEYGAGVQTVRDAIRKLPKNQFIMADVEAELEASFNPMPRAKLRTVLWNMANKTKTIKLIKKGNNAEPAQYERLEPMIRIKRVSDADREQTLFNANQNGAHK